MPLTANYKILSGMFNVANVQEPFSAVAYLANRVPLVKILSLDKVSDEPWSAWMICEGVFYRAIAFMGEYYYS